MKPYLVHKTWIDLDHVLAIGAEVEHIDHISCGAGWLCSFTGHCTCMFLNKPLRFELAEGGRDEPVLVQEQLLKEARETLAAFIAAWKSKDDDGMIHAIGPSVS